MVMKWCFVVLNLNLSPSVADSSLTATVDALLITGLFNVEHMEGFVSAVTSMAGERRVLFHIVLLI
jgi:hypothetical protein